MCAGSSIRRMFGRLSPIIAMVAIAGVAGCTQQEEAVPYDESAAVVAIGDSIMVGASEHLSGLVDGIVIDAQVGRPFADGVAALERQSVATEPPDILVVALGTNGGTNAARIDELIAAAGDVDELIFVNVRVPGTGGSHERCAGRCGRALRPRAHRRLARGERGQRPPLSRRRVPPKRDGVRTLGESHRRRDQELRRDALQVHRSPFVVPAHRRRQEKVDALRKNRVADSNRWPSPEIPIGR